MLTDKEKQLLRTIRATRIACHAIDRLFKEHDDLYLEAACDDLHDALVELENLALVQCDLPAVDVYGTYNGGQPCKYIGNQYGFMFDKGTSVEGHGGYSKEFDCWFFGTEQYGNLLVQKEELVFIDG